MISIVIPAYNEEKHIAACLKSFLHQTTKEPFEIVLVDNNSTDATRSIAEKFLDVLPLRIILEKEKGRGYARSAGFAKAKGDIILSMDADCIAPNDWIEKMTDAFAIEKIVAVTGPVRAYDLRIPKRTLIRFGMPIAMRVYRVLYRHYWLTGSNFGIRKHIYLQSGGFPKMNGFEDIDLGMRVHKLGDIAYKNIWMGTSGRRFAKRSFGLIDYLGAYKDYFLQKKNNVHLSDER